MTTPCHDDFRAAVEWLVHDLGYPFDFGCDVAPPLALREAIVQVVLDDRDDNMHGGVLDAEGVLLWIEDENPAWRSARLSGSSPGGA